MKFCSFFLMMLFYVLVTKMTVFSSNLSQDVQVKPLEEKSARTLCKQEWDENDTSLKIKKSDGSVPAVGYSESNKMPYGKSVHNINGASNFSQNSEFCVPFGLMDASIEHDLYDDKDKINCSIEIEDDNGYVSASVSDEEVYNIPGITYVDDISQIFDIICPLTTVTSVISYRAQHENS